MMLSLSLTKVTGDERDGQSLSEESSVLLTSLSTPAMFICCLSLGQRLSMNFFLC